MTQPLAQHDLDQLTRQLMDRFRISQGNDLIFSFGDGQHKTNFEAIRFWATELVARTQISPSRDLPEHLAQAMANQLVELRPDASEQLAECVAYQVRDSQEQPRRRASAKVIPLYRKD